MLPTGSAPGRNAARGEPHEHPPVVFARRRVQSLPGGLAYPVREGTYGDAHLDDPNVIGVSEFTGNLWAGEGHWTVGLSIDEPADQVRREVADDLAYWRTEVPGKVSVAGAEARSAASRRVDRGYGPGTSSIEVRSPSRMRRRHRLRDECA